MNYMTKNIAKRRYDFDLNAYEGAPDHVVEIDSWTLECEMEMLMLAGGGIDTMVLANTERDAFLVAGAEAATGEWDMGYLLLIEKVDEFRLISDNSGCTVREIVPADAVSDAQCDGGECIVTEPTHWFRVLMCEVERDEDGVGLQIDEWHIIKDTLTENGARRYAWHNIVDAFAGLAEDGLKDNLLAEKPFLKTLAVSEES